MEDKQAHKQGFVATIFLIILGFAFVLLMQNQKLRKHVSEQSNLVESLNDSLKTVTNKDSSQTATISVLQSQNIKDFLTIATKDGQIKRLQDLVRANKTKLTKGSTATIVSTETKIKSTNPTAVTPRDTVVKDNIVYLYPQYITDINMGKWVTGEVVANRDSITLDLVIENDYDIIIGESGKFLSWKKKPFVEITNHNPYTKTKVLRTYKVSTPPKRRAGIGAFAGYGLPLIPNPKFSFMIGVGLQYNIIEF